jgi:CDGSH-type Zn-finger protein
VGFGLQWEEGKKYPHRENYALCRCGKSTKKPYCDGAHSAAGFDGSETASKTNFLSQAEIIDGPELTLFDAQKLCAGARFCDRIGGTWNLTKRSDNPRFKPIAIKETAECPSGRLVIKDKKTGEIVEPKLPPSLHRDERTSLAQGRCPGPVCGRHTLRDQEQGYPLPLRKIRQ